MISQFRHTCTVIPTLNQFNLMNVKYYSCELFCFQFHHLWILYNNIIEMYLNQNISSFNFLSIKSNTNAFWLKFLSTSNGLFMTRTKYIFYFLTIIIFVKKVVTLTILNFRPFTQPPQPLISIFCKAIISDPTGRAF